MSILTFKSRKFKGDIPRGKRLKNLPTEKASNRPGNLVFFSKKMYSKNNNYSSKISKKMKSLYIYFPVQIQKEIENSQKNEKFI